MSGPGTRRRGWRRLVDALTWVGRHELRALVALALAAGGIWAFVAIADEVVEGETHALDERLLLALRTPGDPTDPVGGRVAEEVGRDVTALGSSTWLTFLTLAVGGYLVLAGKRRAALYVVLAVGLGFALSTGLKLGFDRPRPDLVPHGAYVQTASFPSGHSMSAAVVYLTLGALLARVSGPWRIKAYVLLLALLLTVAVGVSRVYLGVHWPTDVLAGWAAGASWALVCWLVARWLQRRGRIESGRPGNGPAPPS